MPNPLSRPRNWTRNSRHFGIAKARAEGKYKGRAPTARTKADKVRELRDVGVGRDCPPSWHQPDFGLPGSRFPPFTEAN